MGRIVKADALAAPASSKAAEPGPNSEAVAAQVTEILVAARESAQTGRTIKLSGPLGDAAR